MKKLLLIALFFTPSVVFAFNVENVGFVDSSIWFEREPFFAGKQVRVYTNLANSTDADVRGTVIFYDNDKEIGRANATLERQGGYQVLFADWMPSQGNHVVSAEFVNVSVTHTDGTVEEFATLGSSAKAKGRFVDSDDDNDGVGNKNDPEPQVAAAGAGSSSGQAGSAGSLTESAKDLASSTIPVVKETTRDVFTALENFRTEQGKKVDEAKERLEAEIEAERSGSGELPEGNTRKTSPFDQVKLLALTAAGYTLGNKFLFYAALILLLIIGWRILKKVWRKIRGRDDY